MFRRHKAIRLTGWSLRGSTRNPVLGDVGGADIRDGTGRGGGGDSGLREPTNYDAAFQKTGAFANIRHNPARSRRGDTGRG